MMTGPRYNEEGRVVPLPDLVPDPHDHSFIVKMMMMMMMGMMMMMKSRVHVSDHHYSIFMQLSILSFTHNF